MGRQGIDYNGIVQTVQNLPVDALRLCQVCPSWQSRLSTIPTVPRDGDIHDAQRRTLCANLAVHTAVSGTANAAVKEDNSGRWRVKGDEFSLTVDRRSKSRMLEDLR